MESPFRDDREAAHMRAEQLAEENEQLRRELAEAKKPKDHRPRSERQRIPLIALTFGGLCLLMGLGGMMFVSRATRATSVAAASGASVEDGKEHIAVSWLTEHAPTASTLRGVWTNGKDTYAVGDGGTILYRTPSGTWSSLQSGTTADLNAIVSSLGTDTIFVLGDRGTILRLTRDTKEWVPEKSNTTATLYAGVRFASSILAVGSGGTALVRDDIDRPWRVVATPTQEDLHAVSETEMGALCAVGNKGTILCGLQGRNVVLQKSGTTEGLRGIVTSSHTDVFAVGTHGTAIRGSSVDLVPWANERSEAQSDLLGATVVHARYEQRTATSGSVGETNAVVAVGRHGVYLVDNLHAKNGFEVHAIPGAPDLFAVAASANEAFAVGANGTIVHLSFDTSRKDPGF